MSSDTISSDTISSDTISSITMSSDTVSSDTTMDALMRDAFGPPSDAPAEGEAKLERGLDAVDALSAADATAVRWLFLQQGSQQEELAAGPRRCFTCGKPDAKSSCAKCGVARYCGRECQVADWGKKGWRGGHKVQCEGYKALGPSQLLESDGARRGALDRLLARIRLYLCPFALAHGSGGGGEKASRGCCFLQIGCSVSTLALPAPRDCAGLRLPAGERSALLHFVTMAEFDAEIAPTEAGFRSARAALADSVAQHDDRTHVVVLVRAACGLVAVLEQPLVPEWRVARTMASEYEGREALQLDFDEL